MSEYTVLLGAGVVGGALLDVYAYYRLKYAQRALEVAESRTSAGGGSLVEGQKTLSELEAEDQSEADDGSDAGGRKTLASRLAEIEGEREAREARRSAYGDAVLFAPGADEGDDLGGDDSSEGASVESVSDEGIEGGLKESLASLRYSIGSLHATLQKHSRQKSGGVSSLGDSSEGVSFSGVGPKWNGDYSEGDGGVVS